jgi:hypothetical protein
MLMDEVGLEFGDHGQDDVQQAPDGLVGSCTDPPRLSLTCPGGALVGSVASVGEGASEPVELRHHERVALATGRERFT